MSMPTTEPTDVEASVLAFIESKTKTTWEVDSDLFRAGGLSSLFAMELIVYLEKSFDVAIVGADMKLDNFRTVKTMAGLVARLRGADGE